MNSRRSRQRDVTSDDLIFLASFVSSFLLTLFILVFIWNLYLCLKSRKFHEKTSTPSQPKWIRDYPLENLTKVNHRYFTIYKKCYLTQMQFPRTEEEKPKRMMKKIRKLLENHFKIPIDSTMIPDSTCLISIPMKNFKCALPLGEFISLRGGPPGDSHYEYQMIGEDRIQVSWFVAGGVRYVAGICIYFKDPYQKPIRYREPIILELLRGPVYWPKWNLKEEKLEVMEHNNELIVSTKSRYGESKKFKFNGEKRLLEDFQEPIRFGFYEFKAQYPDKKLKIEICKFWNTLVMIEEIDGRRMHVSWNKKMRKIDYYKCRSCEESEDIEPPSYQDCTQFQPLIN